MDQEEIEKINYFQYGPEDVPFGTIYEPPPWSQISPQPGYDDLQKLIDKNQKTQKIAIDATSSLSALIKNANAYIMEMQLLEDLESLLKDNGVRSQSQANGLLTNNNWGQLYGLDMNEEVLTGTYSKIRQNIHQLIYECEMPPALNMSPLTNTSESDSSSNDNDHLKQAIASLKQEKRSQSSSGIERPSILRSRGILHQRPKVSRNELQSGKKPVPLVPPRNAVSDEDTSKFDDGTTPRAGFKGLENESKGNRRNLRDFLNVDHLPIY